MAIMRHPVEDNPPRIPLTKDYVPPNSFPYDVKDKEGFKKIADKFGMDVKELIRYNFNTNTPAVVNWYLYHNIGCREETYDKKNFMFSSKDKRYGTGRIYIPNAVAEMPPLIIPGRSPWHKLSFWIELTIYNAGPYKKIKGALAMRIDRHLTNLYGWHISATLIAASFPIKGDIPIGVGEAKSEEEDFFEFNPLIFDPRREWKKKNILIRYEKNNVTLQIKKALQKTPGEDYYPLKGVKTRDVLIRTRMDSTELGWCLGIGSIFGGQKARKRSDGLMTA